MLYEYKFLAALGATIIIETVALFLAVRRIFKINRKEIPDGLLIFSGVLCSAATLPYLWFILPLLIPYNCGYIFIGEILVAAAEAPMLYFILRINIKRSAALSLACNLGSFILGYIFLK